jgi:hypothetical protein
MSKSVAAPYSLCSASSDDPVEYVNAVESEGSPQKKGRKNGRKRKHVEMNADRSTERQVGTWNVGDKVLHIRQSHNPPSRTNG